ncbi:hypothetical protein [Paenibacillus sp. sgz500992]|uniref:hypothetical protein n=1 Tax=Paenibacillus sp. sgz500992 TaxID=3242476 RepID=UPI0036D3A32D
MKLSDGDMVNGKRIDTPVTSYNSGVTASAILPVGQMYTAFDPATLMYPKRGS